MSHGTVKGRVISVNKPLWGLGNRLRAVLGAYALATAEHRDFSYTWPTGTAFGPRLTELWEFDAPMVSPSRAAVLALLHRPLRHDLSWLDDRARAQKVWLIRSPHALNLPSGVRPWEDLFRSLVPRPEIAERVTSFHRDHLAGRPYVGVMIRTHTASHAKTLEASPVEWYLQRMLALRADHPGLEFFLSCDVESTAEAVSAAVPGCHHLSDKGGYNTVPGVRSAVSDLYLLAASSHLLGPHYSSFVELAQFLAGPTLQLETSRTPPHSPDLLRPAVDPLRPSQRPL